MLETKQEEIHIPTEELDSKKKKKKDKDGQKWYCYILGSVNNKFRNSTYVGMTNCVEKRIRQHNKVITGGAKYTSSKGPWQFLLHISGF